MCRNNAPILNFGSFNRLKMNLVSALRRSFFEFPNIFQNHQEKSKKKKKLRKNGNFYA
ncbi:Uncharacterized protein FWK35_00026571 [Aphis craccivora]|uniref:Uncharacterized protein n=1 Tax=Aphis craccivora TaxID=307492 RepID=A0A6G0ZGA9_APHCR|nr:Uncharacterized protein FWK35_00026571 [Aphis craccivora]